MCQHRQNLIQEIIQELRIAVKHEFREPRRFVRLWANERTTMKYARDVHTELRLALPALPANSKVRAWYERLGALCRGEDPEIW